MRILQLALICFAFFLPPLAPAGAATCGTGFTEASSHTAFYTRANAGRLAYAPLAKSTDDGRRAQIFCVFGDSGTYVIEKRPRKLIFVLNNMRSSQEPQANAFIGVRIVRVDSSMVAIETWKNPSDIWESRNGTGYNPYNDVDPEVRDKFMAEILHAANEAEFRKTMGIDIFGTTRPGDNGRSYSTWDRRTQLPKLTPASGDSINFTIIAFENRDTPPNFLSRADRERRVTFEVSPGKSKVLEISTFGPPELNSIETKQYRVEFEE